MSYQDFLNFIESQTFLGAKLSTLLSVIVIVAIALILERVITRYLKKFAKRASLAPGVASHLILTFRLLILIGAIASIIRAGGLPTEWFVAFSALGGASVGLASSKTIGNFIAGLYLLAARPFNVGDYVRIGAVEGIVQEVGINYTRILTIGKNIVSISNLQIMDRDVINYLYISDELPNLYCYNFEIGFNHNVPEPKIDGIFKEVFEQYDKILPKKCSHIMVRSDAFARYYLIFLYAGQPEDIFTLRSQITDEVFKRWDIENARLNVTE